MDENGVRNEARFNELKDPDIEGYASVHADEMVTKITEYGFLAWPIEVKFDSRQMRDDTVMFLSPEHNIIGYIAPRKPEPEDRYSGVHLIAHSFDGADLRPYQRDAIDGLVRSLEIFGLE